MTESDDWVRRGWWELGHQGAGIFAHDTFDPDCWVCTGKDQP